MEKSQLEKMYPSNSIILDDRQMPSVMVYIPKFYLDEVIEGASHAPHPAFVVDGEELDGIYISKFQNVVVDGRAYSLPGLEPTTCIDFDSAMKACTDKGRGFHLMTAMEWGAVALLCQKQRWLPFGNNDLGKDIREQEPIAKIVSYDPEKKMCKVATGTGPIEWSHNRRADGIYDLNGNVWEWNGGIRLFFGEIQVLRDNNGAASQCSQAASSDAWRAIDGTTGEWLLPNGYGTTPNSVKLDYVDHAWQYGVTPILSSDAHFRAAPFLDTKTQDLLCPRAKELLYALGCLSWCDFGIDREVSLYANNGTVERMVFRGGRWGQGLNSGVFKTCMDDPRTYAGVAVGFRSAYYERKESFC